MIKGKIIEEKEDNQSQDKVCEGSNEITVQPLIKQRNSPYSLLS